MLEDSAELTKEGITPGCTIHVFEKYEQEEPEPIKITEKDIATASSAYRTVCFRNPTHTFPVSQISRLSIFKGFRITVAKIGADEICCSIASRCYH